MLRGRFSFLLLVGSIIGVLAGCNSTMRSMVGVHNVDSVQLARTCAVDSALVVVRNSREHQSVVNRSQGLLLEVVYLTDLGRDADAKALYPMLMKQSPWLKSEKEIDRALRRAQRDLGKMRKRSGYEEDCGQK